MKGEHKRFEEPLKSILTPIGFKELCNDDFSIRYGNKEGWHISVDSERYYEGVFRWINTPDNYTYSIFDLIRVFEQLTGKKVELNRFDDWIKFISHNKNWIFIEPQPYRQFYEEVNQDGSN